MRKRKFWRRARSRNGRGGLGPSRVAALERRFTWGQRRWYKHTPYPDDGCRLWHVAWNTLACRKRQGKLFTSDPSGFHQSPANFKINRSREDEQP